MFGRRSALGASAAGAVVLLLLGGSLPTLASAPGPVAGANPPVASHPTGPAAPGRGIAPGAARALLAGIAAAHVPNRFVYLPNLNGREIRHDGVVSPLYDRSPAPMGIMDLGVTNTSGTPFANLLTTSSFRGSVTFTNASVFYLDDDAPDYVGLQLNTVLANVSLLGNASYVFWNQNVVSWSARSHLLQFIDNVWNFSDPSSQISPNVFVASNGTLVAPSFYYAVGPVVNLSLPFTLDLYTNTSLEDQGGLPYDNVWFNFTIVNASGVHPGSYDHVVFNSQDLAAPDPTIPAPRYEVNGATPTPTGFLPYDAEFVLGGPGGGSTTSVLTLNATLRLDDRNATTGAFEAVPSAFGYGTDTGETIEGVSEWYDAGGTVHLGAGPSILTPLWNASPSSRPGSIALTGQVAPSTAFVFLNATTSFSPDFAAWAPVPPGGHVDYRVAPGNYSGEILAADFDPVSFVVNGANASTWVLPGTLTANASRGVYTPLVAWGDPELAQIALSGSGTSTDPYVLPSVGGNLDPIFGQMNDFSFPVFPGLLLLQTRAHVNVIDPPAFSVRYAGAALQVVLGLSVLLGITLPTSNDLQLELYGVANATVYGGAGISGWFTPFLNGFPLANLVLWNVTATLVAANTFLNEGSSLLLFGGGADTIWGNTFVGGDPTVTFPVFGGNVVDLSVYASNDTLYDNSLTAAPAFAATTLLAQSPATTFYTETFAASNVARFVDAWNVSARPAGQVAVVNGFALFGSIVGGRAQGGNFWSDYGSAANPRSVLPYNESGAIAVGGDFLPLVPPVPFTSNVTFTEAGLPAGTSWSVALNGASANAVAAPITFAVPNGSYSYVVAPVAGLVATPTDGSFGVAGFPVVVGIAFGAAPLATFAVSFASSGLAPGTNWSIALGGNARNTSRDTMTFLEPNGTYAYAVGPLANYSVAPPAGNVTVAGAPVTVPVAFAADPGTLTLTLVPLNATVVVDGAARALSNGTARLSLAPGVHAVRASAPGYLTYWNNVTLGPGASVTLAVALAAAGGPTGGPGLPNPSIALIAGAVTLAVVFGVGMVYFWRRPPRGPTPARSYATGEKPPPPGST